MGDNATHGNATNGYLRFLRGPQERTQTVGIEMADQAVAPPEAAEPANEEVDKDAAQVHVLVPATKEVDDDAAERDDDQCLLDRWFVVLSVVLALNVASWGCVSWLIFTIEDYVSDFRKYKSIAITICVCAFFLSLVVVLFIGYLRRKKDFFVWPIKFTGDQRFGWKYLLAFVNALLCFGGVILYYFFARHEYFKQNWDSKINYNETLYPPAFAFVNGYNDAAMANVLGSQILCTYPSYNESNFCNGTAFNTTTTKLMDSPYGNLDAHIFNSTLLNVSSQTYNALSSTISLQLAMNYNSTLMLKKYLNRNLMSPYVFAVIYDTRVNLADALRCGLLSLTEIPAMGSTTFTIFAESMTDKLGYVRPPASSNDQACENFYTETLRMNPPYNSYTFNMASLPNTDLASCDTSNGNSGAFCICQVLIRYGSRVVRSMESVRGMTRLEIFINEGAVVGGIQFFMWFFSLYVL